MPSDALLPPSEPLSRRGLIGLTGAGLAALALSGCGAAGGGSGGGLTSVVTSVYPVAWLVQRIGGEHVSALDLAKPGVDPHGLELSVNEVAQIAEADLVIAIPGFQAAVDDAIATRNPEAELSVYDAVSPLPAAGGHDQHAHGDDAHAAPSDSGDAHADDGAHEGHDHGPEDPHFWHDPVRMADLGDAIAARLAAIDPDRAEAFAAAAADLRSDLETLDAELEQRFGAAGDHLDFVTSHAAFGYLADRYGLHQIGIAGIDPEIEPSPQRLLELERTIADLGITTVFFETTASPAVAETLATTVGVETAELDNLETQLAPDVDYLGAMRSNAEKLLASWA